MVFVRQDIRLSVALLATGLAGAAGASPLHVLEAERFATPPVLDGEFTDWRGAHWTRFYPGAPQMSGRALNWLKDDGLSEPPGTAATAADLSGSFSIRWDDDWIYLAADVTDNVHDVSGGTSLTWYLKDAVALYLDVPDDGDGGDGGGWVLGDHAFAFVAEPSGPGDGRWWRRGEAKGSEESQAPPETRLAVVLSETGYRIEAAIPMAPLTERTPDWRPPFAGRSAGFFLLAADPDGGVRRRSARSCTAETTTTTPTGRPCGSSRRAALPQGAPVPDPCSGAWSFPCLRNAQESSRHSMPPCFLFSKGTAFRPWSPRCPPAWIHGIRVSLRLPVPPCCGSGGRTSRPIRHGSPRRSPWHPMALAGMGRIHPLPRGG